MVKKWGSGFYVGLGVLALSIFLAAKFNIPLRSATKNSLNFKLKNQKNEWVSSREFKGSVVVIHFWASWCPPCLPELGEFLQAVQKLPQSKDGKKIYWVLISQDESWEKAQKVLDNHSIPPGTILLLDPNGKSTNDFGTYQFPETYVLNQDHEMAAKWIGPQAWSESWGENALSGIEKLSRLGKLE